MPHDRSQPVPVKAAAIAMWLFLAALAMLFIASMMAYIMIRTGVFGPQDRPPPPLGSLNIPGSLWVSTAVILIASFTIHLAVAAVRREKQGLLRGYVIATLLLSIAFIIVQVPALWRVLEQHQEKQASGENVMLYGALFFMIVVHAIHVIGGLVYLVMVLVAAAMGKYDHEHYVGVKHAALYWHFLDIVWIVMFAMMLILR